MFDELLERIEESILQEGNWWVQLINALKKDRKFKSLVGKYGSRSQEVRKYFADNYWSRQGTPETVAVAVTDAVKEMGLEEPKIKGS